MATGVQSSVTLDTKPSPDAWNAFIAHPNRVVSIVEMCDGRVHVSCFEPVSIHHADLRAALRERSVTVRAEIEGLNG
jgi:hypothetical protein